MFDDIVADSEFSAIEPVKTYSQGCSRVSIFAVSIHLDPDSILLDEVLAVGDAHFRAKSIASMTEPLERSGTIVFVSHALPQIADFSDRALWLDRGRTRMIGEAHEVVEAYKESVVKTRTLR